MNWNPFRIGGVIGLLFAVVFPLFNYATSTSGYYFGAMDLFGYYIDLDQNPTFAFTLVFGSAALIFIFLGLFLGYLFSNQSSLLLKKSITLLVGIASVTFVIIGPEESLLIAIPTFIATLLSSYYLIKHSRELHTIERSRSIKESLLPFVLIVVGTYLSGSLGGFLAFVTYPVGAILFLVAIINLGLNVLRPKTSLPTGF